MNLDESIEQISSMCPSFTYDEIKSDLSVTNDVELTVNRLLDKSITNVGTQVELLCYSCVVLNMLVNYHCLFWIINQLIAMIVSLEVQHRTGLSLIFLMDFHPVYLMAGSVGPSQAMKYIYILYIVICTYTP